MPQPLHTGRLILTPEDPYYLPDNIPAILEGLLSIGFIGSEIPGASAHYLPGHRFMQLVTFLGCSPAIRMQPGDADEPFCHLTIAGPYHIPQLLYGENTSPPRCEACRKRLNDWRNALDTWNGPESGVFTTCPHCGHKQDPVSFDWRRSAGWGRLFLYVENIFPQEAIPTQALLAQLQSTTCDQHWHYFYQQQKSPE